MTMPTLLPKRGLASFSSALATYRKADDQLQKQELTAAFDTLFGLESMLGHQAGLEAAERAAAALKAKRRHRLTLEDKRVALTYYIENDLGRLSNQKAAEVLEKQVPREIRTLKAYIAEYRKFKEVIKESKARSVHYLKELERVAAILEDAILFKPEQETVVSPLLSNAKRAIKEIEVKMLEQHLSYTLDEVKENLDWEQVLGDLELEHVSAKLHDIAAEIWSDRNGPYHQR